MGRHVLITDENQTGALEHLLAPNAPKGAWRIQRRDGAYWNGISGGGTGVDVFSKTDGAGFSSASSAQHIIDINLGSARGRLAFRDCAPVCVVEQPKSRPVLPRSVWGEHVVCACGQIHEADNCPTANGHGMVL